MSTTSNFDNDMKHNSIFDSNVLHEKKNSEKEGDKERETKDY